jgi:threonine dehydrogenase-like Zn-dependent dehydrogenase
MRATVLHSAGDVRIENVPDATLIEPTDALVVISRAAICGSDLWPYKSPKQGDTGRRLGHEAVGVVEAIGAEVRAAKVGDLVVMPWAYSDGRCEFCHQGLQTSCVQGGVFGTHGPTAPRPRRSVSPTPTEPSWSSRSARTTRCCPLC